MPIYIPFQCKGGCQRAPIPFDYELTNVDGTVIATLMEYVTNSTYSIVNNLCSDVGDPDYNFLYFFEGEGVKYSSILSLSSQFYSDRLPELTGACISEESP